MKPIKRKIRLQLTTFDVEAFEKDKNLAEIPLKTVEQTITLQHSVTDIQNELNSRVDKFYREEIKNLKKLLERQRESTVEMKKVIKGNVVNCDNIVCDIIEGNVVNCDDVKCKIIKGKTVNCDIKYQNC